MADGQVGGTHGLLDDEVLALSATAQEFSRRIDAALALLDPAEIHHIAGPLADKLRRVLTGQDGESDVSG